MFVFAGLTFNEIVATPVLSFDVPLRFVILIGDGDAGGVMVTVGAVVSGAVDVVLLTLAEELDTLAGLARS